LALEFEEQRASQDQSTARVPGGPVPDIDRGIALAQAGDFAAASLICEEVLAITPAHAGAVNLLGAIAHRQGRHAAALALFSRAVEIDGSVAYHHANLGSALASLGRPEEGLASLERAIALDPDQPDALNSYAYVLGLLGRPDAAMDYLERAIRLSPGHANALYNRGNMLLAQGRHAEAVSAYDLALAVAPRNAGAHINRGFALRELKRHEEALASYDAALAVDPDKADAHHNRSNCLYDLGRLEAALDACEAAIRLEPSHVEALVTRGAVLSLMQRFDESLASYDAAIAHDPHHAVAYANRGMARLLTGDFHGGWADSEWRKRLKTPIARWAGPEPEWSGAEDIRGKTVLLHWEQGFGDTLQFCRYAPWVAARGARVIMSVPHALVALLSGLDPRVAVIADTVTPPPFDLHAPLMSLPLIFGTDLGSIPGPVPYLRPDPKAVAGWREALGERRGPRVGLVWNGGARPDQPHLWHANERRNMPFAQMANLNLPELDFFSLQKGEPAESELPALRAAHWPGPNFTNLAAELTDFSRTAALIANLDLVITVDTAMAHLAGALGAPVWLLLPQVPDWRWLLGREDSPWYPTMRLFRQSQRGDWPELVARVRGELALHFGKYDLLSPPPPWNGG
jgi:tetratricopeptide (TPR) repeat protein